MSKSRRSSNVSAPCRFEWRPSHWLTTSLVALALLAPFSLLVSDVPPALAWPLVVLVLGEGVRLLRGHLRAPARQLCIPAGRAAASCDGLRIDGLRLRWRGPLAFLDWRQDGRQHRLVLWPDVLDAPGRRELKLAMQKREAAGGGPSMAG